MRDEHAPHFARTDARTAHEAQGKRMPYDAGADCDAASPCAHG